MRKQDWSPRDFGVPLRKLLDTSVGAAWWNALRDYRQCLGTSRFEEFLGRLCHRRGFRDLAVREIKKKTAVPSSRRLESAEDIARMVCRMLEKMNG